MDNLLRPRGLFGDDYRPFPSELEFERPWASANSSARAETSDAHPVGEFLSVFDVAFKILTGTEPKKTLAWRDNGKIDAGYRDGWTDVKLPKLSIHEVIVIELGPDN